MPNVTLLVHVVVFEPRESESPSQGQGWGKASSGETVQKGLLGNPTTDRKPQSSPRERRCKKRWYFSPGSKNSFKRL